MFPVHPNPSLPRLLSRDSSTPSRDPGTRSAEANCAGEHATPSYRPEPERSTKVETPAPGDAAAVSPPPTTKPRLGEARARSELRTSTSPATTRRQGASSCIHYMDPRANVLPKETRQRPAKADRTASRAPHPGGCGPQPVGKPPDRSTIIGRGRRLAAKVKVLGATAGAAVPNGLDRWTTRVLQRAPERGRDDGTATQR